MNEKLWVQFWSSSRQKSYCYFMCATQLQHHLLADKLVFITIPHVWYCGETSEKTAGRFHLSSGLAATLSKVWEIFNRANHYTTIGWQTRPLHSASRPPLASGYCQLQLLYSSIIFQLFLHSVQAQCQLTCQQHNQAASRGCHSGSCCRSICDRGQTLSQRSRPQNSSYSGSRRDRKLKTHNQKSTI